MRFGPDGEEIETGDEDLAAEMPERISRLPLYRQNIWRRTFRKSFEETGDRNQAEIDAWVDAVEPESGE